MAKCPRREECANFTLDPYNGECMFNSCLESGEKPYKRYRRFVRKPIPKKANEVVYHNLVEAISRHPIASNDPDVIDALNAIQDALLRIQESRA